MTNCGKFLERWEYQTTIPVSWEICMQVKKQQIELDMVQEIGSKLGRGYNNAAYCHHPFNFYSEYIIWSAKLDELQAGIKIARRNVNNLRYSDDTTLMVESEEELKSFWWKKGVEKLGWNSQHSKNYDQGIWFHHFMAQRKKSGSTDRFFFLGFQNHYGWWLQPWN